MARAFVVQEKGNPWPAEEWHRPDPAVADLNSDGLPVPRQDLDAKRFMGHDQFVVMETNLVPGEVMGLLQPLGTTD